MCLFVVFRAIKLDRQTPWFGSAKADREAGHAAGEGETDAP
jgi:hypothetical protein